MPSRATRQLIPTVATTPTLRRRRPRASRWVPVVVAALASSLVPAAPVEAETRSVRDPRDAVVPRLDVRKVSFDNRPSRLRATVDLRGLRARGGVQLTLRFRDTSGYDHSAVATRYASGAVTTSWTWEPTFGGAATRCSEPMDVRLRPARNKVVMTMPTCHGAASRYLMVESSRPDATAVDHVDLDGRIATG